MRAKRPLGVLLAALLALPVGAARAADPGTCADTVHRGRDFTVCTADLDRHRIGLHLRDAAGRTIGTFRNLEAGAGPVLFAMNAGMYHHDRSPVGLYVEDGRRAAALVTAAGPGNFGMLPNGVFCAGPGGARVVESRAFAAAPPDCEIATQSGPMLLIDGAPHPRFLADSPYRNVRNGVGATPDGRRVHFAISNEPVTFHEMATLFRDALGVRDALYLDGRVSRLHAPGQGRSDGGWPMGPILSVSAR